MPPKSSSKKSKKDKVKTKSKVAEQVKPAPTSIFQDAGKKDIELLRRHVEANDYITIDLVMTDWEHASFSVVCRTNTTLWTIRRYIQERHGHVEGLRLFRSNTQKKNQLRDFSQTLAELAFIGGQKEAGLRETLCYDFGPIRGDPIVQREPALILPPQPNNKTVAGLGSLGLGLGSIGYGGFGYAAGSGTAGSGYNSSYSRGSVPASTTTSSSTSSASTSSFLSHSATPSSSGYPSARSSTSMSGGISFGAPIMTSLPSPSINPPSSSSSSSSSLPDYAPPQNHGIFASVPLPAGGSGTGAGPGAGPGAGAGAGPAMRARASVGGSGFAHISGIP